MEKATWISAYEAFWDRVGEKLKILWHLLCTVIRLGAPIFAIVGLVLIALQWLNGPTMGWAITALAMICLTIVGLQLKENAY